MNSALNLRGRSGAGLESGRALDCRLGGPITEQFMRKTLPFLAVLVIGSLMAGCANPEKKLGRGLNNTLDVVRLGELRRTMEQSALFDGGDYSYTSGFVKGFNRTVARTCLGVYEVVTFPLPTPGHGYDPLFTDTFVPGSVYPDNYRPHVVEDSTYATDSNLGFSGGDIAPMFPGSRFRVFDTH